jgi:hypothetical protein
MRLAVILHSMVQLAIPSLRQILTANSTGTTAFNQTVNAASLTTDAGGTTQLNGNVTTTGSQTYGDAVTIANNPILSGSDITFNNTVDGSSDLTVNAVAVILHSMVQLAIPKP